MYDFIKSMNLGNLSSLKSIPEYFVNCLLKFIIHVTRAFAHAHENNIVHGNFNLARVVAQKIEDRNILNQYSSRSFIGKATARGDGAPAPDTATSQHASNNHHINYIVVNFEPWRVD
jgi:hypothetical protein